MKEGVRSAPVSTESADVLRSTDLFGTEVAPIVRAEIARRTAAAPAPVAADRAALCPSADFGGAAGLAYGQSSFCASSAAPKSMRLLREIG